MMVLPKLKLVSGSDSAKAGVAPSNAEATATAVAAGARAGSRDEGAAEDEDCGNSLAGDGPA